MDEIGKNPIAVEWGNRMKSHRGEIGKARELTPWWPRPPNRADVSQSHVAVTSELLVSMGQVERQVEHHQEASVLLNPRQQLCPVQQGNGYRRSKLV